MTGTRVDTTGFPPLARYCLRLGDDAFVLSHRLSEWITNAPWFHVGSLSSGYGYVIADDSGGAAIPASQDSDWALRASWWERFARTADGLPDHLTHYRAEIAAFIERSGLSRSDIDAWDQAYQGWITWQETT